MENNGEHIGQVEADVQPDEDLNKLVHKAALGWHKNPHELD